MLERNSAGAGGRRRRPSPGRSRGCGGGQPAGQRLGLSAWRLAVRGGQRGPQAMRLVAHRREASGPFLFLKFLLLLFYIRTSL